METSVKITLIIVLGILIAGAGGGFLFWKAFYSTGDTITVQGISTVKAMPDLISVYFNVETNGSTAQEAKDKNSEIVNKLIDNCVNAGVDSEKITTESFNIYEDYAWEDNKQKFRGYKASHLIKVKLTSSQTEIIGAVIDAGVNAGAMVNYINFELSSEIENQYKAEALKKAGEDAGIKAEAIASGLGKQVGEIQSIQQSDFYYNPWRVYDSGGIMAEAGAAKEAVTNIQPGERDVTAQITVVFRIE